LRAGSVASGIHGGGIVADRAGLGQRRPIGSF